MKQKTVGIYDRWLHTLGGGEQVAFAYAETFRDLGFKVSLLCHDSVDIKEAENKMNVNLSKILIKKIPFIPDEQLQLYSEEFDVFICNSYLDYIPSSNTNSYLSLFFPTQVSMRLFDHLYKNKLFRNTKKLRIYPIKFINFKYDQYRRRTVYKWLGNASSILFLEAVSALSLELFFEYLSTEVLEGTKFLINGIEIKPSDITTKLESNRVTFSFKHKIKKDAVLSFKIPQQSFANKVGIVNTTIRKPKYFFFNLLKKIIPVFEMRLSGGFSFSSYSNIASYKDILVISKFSQNWIKKYWQLPSTILYPPVSTHDFKPAKNNKNQIVNIGRFFVDGHNKKQLEMAYEFAKMCEQGLKDWELHLIGSIAEGTQNFEYIKRIKEIAKDYPIKIHISIPFLELKKILSESKIYWHATGLDINENKNPIMLEHFGITTVEAMASGCVPVVINKGGQPEIVTTQSGFTWNTREELKNTTFRLIQDKKLFKSMSKKAIKRSQFFSRAEFKKRLIEIINTNSITPTSP